MSDLLNFFHKLIIMRSFPVKLMTPAAFFNPTHIFLNPQRNLTDFERIQRYLTRKIPRMV
jgi:hypothetical protein